MTNPTSSSSNITENLLFEYFSTLATAPEGIARLRELILQLAVQGKLGTQDAGDEPANLLLEKIRKEKERLVKKTEIKKGFSVEPLKNDEIPFEIPANWIWIKLGEITIITDRDHRTPQYRSNGIPLVSPKIFTKTGIDFSQAKFVDDEELRLYRRKCNFQKGDILYSRIGTIGEARIIDFDHDFVALHSIALIKPVNENVNSNYLCLLLSSNFVKNQAIGYVKSVSVPDLGLQKMNNFIVPLPPLAEQHRIVAKVDRLMALCDELEIRQQNERAGCLKLGIASLAGLQNADSPEEFGRQWAQVCEAFDLILDCPENVAVLRQTILQLAVQGRLVRQEPGDEPAIQIINKTQSKQTKDQKHLKILRDGEVPFLIPDGWEWTRIRFIANVLGGLTKNADRPSYPKKLPYLRVANVQAGILDLETLKEIGVEENEIPRYLLNDGDLLIVEGNGSINHIGRVALWNGEISPCLHQNHIIKIRFSVKEIGPYVMNWLLSTEGRNQITKVASTTSGLYTLNITKVSDLIIPLPPLAEQHRIVAKVDALMALCDALESRLKERAGVQARLAGAVVKQVAGG